MSHGDNCVQSEEKEPESLEEAIMLGLSDDSDGELGQACGCVHCHKRAKLISKRVVNFFKRQQHIQAERISLLVAPVTASARFH